MSTPTFSIAIAAYNEREHIADAIRSVQQQTREDWEAVVVDDGSTDGTAEVVRPFTAADPRVSLISKENAGLSAARNTAIAATEAPFVSFLDGDDMWLPDYLEAMAAAMERVPSAGIAYTDAWAMDADTLRFRRRPVMSGYHPDSTPTDPIEAIKALATQNFIWVSATVRRSALTEAGWFREDFHLTEDIELWIRILAAGYTLARAPGPALGIRRHRDEGLSQQDLGNVESLQRVMRLLVADREMPEPVKEVARARIDELERWRRALSGESRAGAAALALRRFAGTAKRAVTARRDWLSEPPEEVRTAFPGLASG
jgi:GT2 family glycosyltransferase